MNLLLTPILANGMIMFDVLFTRMGPMLVALVVALVAVVSASLRNTPKTPPGCLLGLSWSALCLGQSCYGITSQ